VFKNKYAKVRVFGRELFRRLLEHKAISRATNDNKQSTNSFTLFLMNDNLQLGELICKHLKQNGQSVTWLAKQLNCDRKKLYVFFNNTYSDTEFLFNICRVLKCDFFVYFSKELSKMGITNKAL
jgi:hypothetical protein